LFTSATTLTGQHQHSSDSQSYCDNGRAGSISNCF